MHHVSALTHVLGPSHELAADLPAELHTPPPAAAVNPAAPVNNWQLLANLPGAIIHDISFATPLVGYAVAEAGQVWKTTDGGAHWSEIMNLSFPYYWYGVQALSASDVVISGFIDDVNCRVAAVVRWSHDGGATWTPDIVLSTTAWSFRIRYADLQHGLIMDPDGTICGSPRSPNIAHYTTDGGATATDWTTVFPNPDPNSGWFGNQFSLLPDMRARASGITYCDSMNGGVNWSCRPHIDPVFDGETFFADDNIGWVASGEISPNVEGWVHRTTDGGKTWSGRTLDGLWPIRELRFISPQIGWAAGGNIYSNVGGIYFSNDGGQTWSLDLDSGGYEMDACDVKTLNSGNLQVWCAGYNHSFNGVVYTLQIPGSASGTTVISSLNPSAVGQSVTFTATVSASSGGTPTGTVNFKDGTNTIAAGQALNSSGGASFSTTTLTAGAHSITAVYNGDGNHSTSTSPVLTQVVNNAQNTPTSTALTMTVTPLPLGQPSNVVHLKQSAILTATITPSPGANGMVTFTDGTTQIGSASVTGGVATLDVSKLLTVGQHAIKAVYSGGGGFQGSLSTPVTVLHSPKPR